MNRERLDVRKETKILRIGAAFAVPGFLAIALLYLGFAHGKSANASPLPDLLSSLPGGAPMLVYVDLAAVRASSFYQHRPDKSPIAVPNTDYADFVRSTGFDFEKDLDRFVMASWPPTEAGKSRNKTVAIAEGHFDRAKIRQYATSKGKIEQQQGHEVFLFSSPSGSNAVTFLDDHRVALVTGPSIAPLLEAHAGTAADPVHERAAHVDGAAAFVITQVPPNQDYTAGKDAGAAVTQLASLVRSLQWVTLAASPVGDNLRVSLEGECDNGADAHQIESMLEVARMFGKASLEGPKNKQSMDPATFEQLDSLLGSATITQTGERVRILLEVTPEIFKLKAKPASQPTAQK